MTISTVSLPGEPRIRHSRPNSTRVSTAQYAVQAIASGNIRAVRTNEPQMQGTVISRLQRITAPRIA